MVHYKFNNGSRVRHSTNWTFTTNPYITTKPQINCVGDECKRIDLNVYYQYGEMDINPPVLLQYIPLIAIISVLIIVIGMFLYKRAKDNKRYEESLLSRMGDVVGREYVDAF